MRLPVALLLVVTVIVGCEKAPTATSEPAKTEAVAANAAPPAPPPPPPLVDAETLRELAMVNDHERETFPIPEPEPTPAPDETTASFQKRHRKWASSSDAAIINHRKQYRRFCLSPEVSGECGRTAMSRYLKEKGAAFTGRWQCSVFDVKAAGTAVEILCSTRSVDDWDYAVWGVLEKGIELKKGDLIRFEKLDGAGGRQGDLHRMMYVNNRNFEGREKLKVEFVRR